MPILTIAIATTLTKIGSIELGNLPQDTRWRYAVFCQGGEPEMRFARPDISLTVLDGTGAANSRNAALAACETELLLFSDDDVRLLPEGLSALIDAFLVEPGLALVAGRTLREDGRPERLYPAREQRLTLFNSAHIGTVELATRPARIRDADVRFNERFGAGTDNPLGDEYIFVVDCLRAGLDGRFMPISIAVHRGASSGADFRSATLTQARARVFEHVFGVGASVPIKLAFFWRHRRRFGSLREAWTFAREFLPLHH